MSDSKNQLNTQFVQKQPETSCFSQDNLPFHQTSYKTYASAPQITFTGLSMVILCPVLVTAHLLVAKYAQIPIIQYSFVSLLIGFMINYILIIRKYELMPFLPQQIYDNKLKRGCLLCLGGVLCSMVWGWNGSGGMIFAIIWEQVRGSKMGSFGYLYTIIIVGSLLMETNYTYWKLVEFLPGVFFGMVNSILFTLKDSSTYAITHQFLFITSICLPMLFPATHLIVPNLIQWVVMVLTGISMLFTVLLTVKLMQSERVSIVMAIMSGIVMLGTSSYTRAVDFIGAAVIFIGVIFTIKREYFDLEY